MLCCSEDEATYSATSPISYTARLSSAHKNALCLRADIVATMYFPNHKIIICASSGKTWQTATECFCRSAYVWWSSCILVCVSKRKDISNFRTILLVRLKTFTHFPGAMRVPVVTLRCILCCVERTSVEGHCVARVLGSWSSEESGRVRCGAGWLLSRTILWLFILPKPWMTF